MMRHPKRVRRVSTKPAINAPLDDYVLQLKALAGYAGLSVRRLRQLLIDPFHPIPHYRLGGRILVRRSEFDTWLQHYRARPIADLHAIVDDVVREVTASR
jgi:hypothetical protein